MVNKAIVTENLTKFYGKNRGVVDLSLEVKSGEIFGFLGPNGAGKTTTIRLLLNLIHPTKGKAEIFGLDSRYNSLEIRNRLGYLPGDVVLYDGMTGNEFLRLMGSFHKGNNGRRLKEIQEILELDLSRQTRAYTSAVQNRPCSRRD